MEKTPVLSESENNLPPVIDRAMARIAARETYIDEQDSNPEVYWAKLHTPTERAGYTIDSNIDEERWGLSDQWFDAENRIIHEMNSQKISTKDAEAKLNDVKSVIDKYHDIDISYNEAGKLLDIISGKVKPSEARKKPTTRRPSNKTQMLTDNANARYQQIENQKIIQKRLDEQKQKEQEDQQDIDSDESDQQSQ